MPHYGASRTARIHNQINRRHRLADLYYGKINSILSPSRFFVPDLTNSGKIRERVSNTGNLGNTTPGSSVNGFPSVAFNGTTALLDASSFFTGAIPITLSFLTRINITNTDGNNRWIFYMAVDANNQYWVYVTVPNVLTVRHEGSNNTKFLEFPFSGQSGIFDIGITVDESTFELYVNGSEEDSDTIGTAPSGTLTATTIGNISVAGSGISGDMVFAALSTEKWTAQQFEDIANA